ncbi:MAG TPA: phage portal protein, partial [Nitrososphaera sp.]
RTRIIRLPDNSIIYGTYLETGEERYLTPDEVVHIKAFGTGTYGISPIGAARRAIGIGIASDEYAARFYQNDARPGGVLETEKTMTEEQYLAFKQRWQSAHQGVSQSHLVAILDSGMKWSDVGIPMGDHQFIDNRKFQALDVCRIFRVQPHKAMFVDEGTVSYASVEQFNIDFVTDTIRPWATRLEKAVQRGLFSSEPDKAKKLYCQFQLNGLLRGDMAARSTFYEKGIAAGWLLKNEVRQLEDMPAIDGLDDPPEPVPPPVQLVPPPVDNPVDQTPPAA